MSKQSTNKGEIDALAIKYALAFMTKEGKLARRFTRRGSLKQLYEDTTMAWMTEELSKESSPPDFGKVLFAMAHHMKVVRVVRNGQELLWNRYRDNNGEQIEFDERRQHRRSQHRDESREYRDDKDYDSSRRDHSQRHYHKNGRDQHYYDRRSQQDRRGRNQGRRHHHHDRRDHSQERRY